jgi:hypothetical protein
MAWKLRKLSFASAILAGRSGATVGGGSAEHADLAAVKRVKRRRFHQRPTANVA